jgi:hypothetical protein
MGAKITGFAMVTLPKLMGLSRKILCLKKRQVP